MGSAVELRVNMELPRCILLGVKGAMAAPPRGGIVSASAESARPAAPHPCPLEDAPAATQRAENSVWRTSLRLHKLCSAPHASENTIHSICQGGSHALGDGNHGFVPRACGVRGAGARSGDPPCANPGALGLARTVEVDTTGGPGFGFEQYKQHDFLVLKEVVLTFDDGPWPVNTRAVLDALAQQCVKATFFPIGKHALWHPEILKQVAAEGHTVGGHTWSHANLGSAKAGRSAWQRRTSPSNRKTTRSIEEIEKGFSAIKLALGAPPQPFFRFPYLKDPKEAVATISARAISPSSRTTSTASTSRCASPRTS